MGLGKKLTLAMTGVGLCLALPGCEKVKEVAADAAGLPTDKNILFWTDDQRNKAFRMMDTLVPSNTIEAGSAPKMLAQGKALPEEFEVDGKMLSVDQYMDDQRTAGIVILQDGKIRLEEYRMDFGKDDRWTSFSVAKSLVSTMVGAAIKDGSIKSIDDPLTDYIPELEGSGYDGVTVEQLLTMTSGVQWNEDYADPKSDVALFNSTKPVDGVDPIIVYMKTLKNEAEPGTRWQYNTGETNLIGVLVAKATGKTISQYLSEKVWMPYGMSQDAEWLLNEGGKEIGGCCISATIRDYTLFGQFAMNGGVVDGRSIVPDGWFAKAGTKQADIGVPGRGYGYQWWTLTMAVLPVRAFSGRGYSLIRRANWSSRAMAIGPVQRPMNRKISGSHFSMR